MTPKNLREARREIALLRVALTAVKKVVTARRKQHYWDDLVKILRRAGVA